MSKPTFLPATRHIISVIPDEIENNIQLIKLI